MLDFSNTLDFLIHQFKKLLFFIISHDKFNLQVDDTRGNLYYAFLTTFLNKKSLNKISKYISSLCCDNILDKGYNTKSLIYNNLIVFCE